MKKAIFFSLALAIFALASAKSASACSCVASSAPVKEQIRNAFSGAEAVFSGEVLEIKESPEGKETPLLVRFKVSKSWKGSDQQEITIRTASNSAMCGYSFTAGQKYLVYAYASGPALSTNNCSRTTTLSSKGDSKYLDKLRRKKKSAA